MQIFRFSVWRGRPTPGSALMNLRYRDERPVSQESRAGDAIAVDAQASAAADGPHAVKLKRGTMFLHVRQQVLQFSTLQSGKPVDVLPSCHFCRQHLKLIAP